MSIVWRDAMSVGNDVIDNDIKITITIINRLKNTISETNIDHKKVKNILLELASHTSQGFVREEEIQRLAQYPFCAAHWRAHHDILRRLASLLNFYAKAEVGDEDSIAPDIFNLLKDWLFSHIIQYDLLMKPYLEKLKFSDVETGKLISLNKK